MTDTLILVNAANPLPFDWVPDDLVDLWEQQPRHFLLPKRREYLVRSAFEAANALFAAAERAGFLEMEVRSCYRDAERQAALYERSQSGEVARPGESEHQTGLAMDVGTWHGPFLSEGNAAERDWVSEHCWDYGFIIRYPGGCESLTGVPAEPWHLRYVGREAALEMRDRGWVLEEWHAAHGVGETQGTALSASRVSQLARREPRVAVR